MIETRREIGRVEWPGRPEVYLAGPIDFDPGRTLHMGGWRHADWRAGLAVKFYCPICENVGARGDNDIMQRNYDAWHDRASRMVAFWDNGVASFGTPIEIWEWGESKGLGSWGVFVVCRGEPGVFLRWLQARGRVILGESFVEAREWLTASLRL